VFDSQNEQCRLVSSTSTINLYTVVVAMLELTSTRHANDNNDNDDNDGTEQRERSRRSCSSSSSPTPRSRLPATATTTTTLWRSYHDRRQRRIMTCQWIFGLAFFLEFVTCVLRFGFHKQSTKDTASTVGKLTGGIRIHHGYIGLVMILLDNCHGRQRLLHTYQQIRTTTTTTTTTTAPVVPEVPGEEGIDGSSMNHNNGPSHPPPDTSPRWWWIRVVGWALLISDLTHHFAVLWPVTGSPQFDLVYPPTTPNDE